MALDLGCSRGVKMSVLGEAYLIEVLSTLMPSKLSSMLVF